MRSLFRRIAENKSGFYLALAAILFVCGWRVWTMARRPFHWREIASELGSVPQFRQQLAANHGNTAVVFTRDLENGMGCFLCDIATHETHLLCETVPELYGWSPDDSRFAYGMATANNSREWELVVCDGKSGKPVARLRHPGFRGPGMFAWLSSRSFGYLVGSDFGSVEQMPDGTWVEGKTVRGVATIPTCFTAVSETSVAWEEQNGVNQAAYNGTDQQWRVTLVNGNQYEIAAPNGLALAGPTRGSQLVLQAYTGASEQLWTFTANGTNYNITNVGSGENMDDNRGGGPHAAVIQWKASSTNANQLWKLTGVGANPPPPTPTGEINAIANGLYEISCPSGGDYALNYSGNPDIHLLDINSGSVASIWKSTNNILSEFIYSKESGEFLLNCSDENGQYLIRCYPWTKWTADAGRVNKPQICTLRRQSDWKDDSPIFVSSWKNNSPRSVYLSDDGLNTFCVAAKTNSEWLRLPWGGGVYFHTSLNGDHLYVTGYPTNEPPGVWDYDIADGSLNCLVSILGKPFKYAKYVTPIYGEVTNAFGRVTGYSLWQPANFSPRKKYPVIICQTVNGEWLPYLQTAANCGCYFAMANRPYWLSKKLQDWPADVMGLYELLAKNPNMDTNRVFLWGHSAETSYLSRLFMEKPGLWDGMILSDPGALPDLENLRGKKLFIITGKDAGNAEQLKTYQDQAVAAGISLKLILQENSGHNAQSIHNMRERTIEFAKFLAEDL